MYGHPINCRVSLSKVVRDVLVYGQLINCRVCLQDLISRSRTLLYHSRNCDQRSSTIFQMHMCTRVLVSVYIYFYPPIYIRLLMYLSFDLHRNARSRRIPECILTQVRSSDHTSYTDATIVHLPIFVHRPILLRCSLTGESVCSK